MSPKEAAAQANSESAKQQRRDHNQKLAEALVRPWSALEMQIRMDKALADSLDGVNDGTFNPDDPKYHIVVGGERSLGGSEAAAATHRAREERKRKEAQFVSNQLGRKK